MSNDSQNILYSPNLSGIAKYISDSAKNIIVMVGAGISVSAGIPDFRTPGTGLYSKLESYNLPYPEAIFSLDFFRNNPEPFYTLAKEIYPGLHCPTPTHYFLKLLQDKNKLLRVYTQNIDSLESIAGLDKSKIIAAHGNFDTASCIDTGEIVNPEEVRKNILLGKEGWSKMNAKYGGLVKPDIVFFGENLPKKFFDNINDDFSKCDLLIVMGTSLKVNPFASLIDNVSDTTPRLLINREKVGQYSDDILSNIVGLRGFDFDNPNTLDIALLKDCDDGVKQLANKLGWLSQLEKLVYKGRVTFNINNSIPKKTYLQYILDQLSDTPIDYIILINKIKDIWSEDNEFDETYVIKSIIRGIKEHRIEQIIVKTEKNKYKGHQYKLI